MDTLSTALQKLRENPEPILEIFQGRPENEQQEIREYFGTHEVPVKLGYPRAVIDLPGLFVTIGTSQEDGPSIGLSFGDTETPIDFASSEGTFLRTQVKIACWTLNANLTVWLQNMALWALLYDRQALADQFEEQQVSLRDFEPLPQWFPDFSFRRDLVLATKHKMTVVKRWPKIAEINVTAEEIPSGVTTSIATRPGS